MKEVFVQDPKDFDATVKQQTSEHQNVYVLIEATNDEATGEPWCPDCRLILPWIPRAFDGKDGILIRSPIPKEGYKEHAYRSHPILHLSEIPTFYKWGTDQTLVEHFTEEQLRNFVE
eukprot:TRINITY_DN15146_c0_g1_i1.p1 TRINITY_DN15146_c0_g1~~TRINITY_DN15146_c0_g1_i1.p1  ORF type:complete len:117 (-),score=26.70 TRINITY_DN15146_c0_g1_i1:35-385(-)